MNRNIIDRKDTSFFSETANTLVYEQAKLLNFIENPFSKDAFKSQIEKKKQNYTALQRNVLCEYVNSSYEKVQQSNSLSLNIKSLADKDCFTITTGHQLNLFTGPVFFIYKIMHVIKMCEYLNTSYPNNKFVPVYWMASEDHDFEEINHIHLFGNKIGWESEQGGAVGRFDLKGIEKLKEEVKSYFQNNPEVLKFIDATYSEKDNLTQATFNLVNSLFNQYGLLIIDGDNAKLKKSFSGIMKDELENSFSARCVRETTERLVTNGYKAQVHPRDINLFYLQQGSRDRIIRNEDGSYKAGSLNFTSDELLNLLSTNPSNFSPNVVLRPLYQEFLLPNLSYVGGGGEMAYWLQLKGVFDASGVTYPLIQVRNSVQIISESLKKRIDKLGLSFDDFLKEESVLKKKFIAENSDDEIDFSDIDENMQKLKESIIANVNINFKQLESFAASEVVKIEKQLSNFKGKITKEQKKKFENSLGQIEKIYSSLFPNRGLAERYENVLSYFAQYGVSEFLEMVHENIDPFEKGLIVLD